MTKGKIRESIKIVIKGVLCYKWIKRRKRHRVLTNTNETKSIFGHTFTESLSN